MRKTLVSLMLLLLQLACNRVAADVELVHAVPPFDFPPYQVIRNGQPVGPDSNLIREIFRRMDGYSVRFEIIPSGRLHEAARTGRMDSGYSFADTYTKSVALISEYPLHSSTYGMYTLRGNKTIRTESDLEGKVVGGVIGLAVNSAFESYLKSHKATFKVSPNFETQLLQLRSERVDAILSNRVILDSFRSNPRYQVDLVDIDLDFPRVFPLYFALSKATTAADPHILMDKINTVMGDMRSDGTWDRIATEFILP